MKKSYAKQKANLSIPQVMQSHSQEASQWLSWPPTTRKQHFFSMGSLTVSFEAVVANFSKTFLSNCKDQRLCWRINRVIFLRRKSNQSQVEEKLREEKNTTWEPESIITVIFFLSWTNKRLIMLSFMQKVICISNDELLSFSSYLDNGFCEGFSEGFEEIVRIGFLVRLPLSHGHDVVCRMF